MRVVLQYSNFWKCPVSGNFSANDILVNIRDAPEKSAQLKPKADALARSVSGCLLRI